MVLTKALGKALMALVILLVAIGCSPSQITLLTPTPTPDKQIEYRLCLQRIFVGCSVSIHSWDDGADREEVEGHCVEQITKAHESGICSFYPPASAQETPTPQPTAIEWLNL